MSVTDDMPAVGNTSSVRFRTFLERGVVHETAGCVARDTADEIRGDSGSDVIEGVEPGEVRQSKNGHEGGGPHGSDTADYPRPPYSAKRTKTCTVVPQEQT